MRRKHIATLCVLVLVCAVNTSEARLFDKWGFRFGSGQVIGDNVSGNIRGYDVRSGLFALNGAFLMEPEYHLWLELSSELRYATWRKYDFDAAFRRTCTYESTLSTALLYDIPLRTKPKFHLACRIGLEHNYLHPFAEVDYDDYRIWKHNSWSWLIGGEVAVPVGVPELVFAVRYNEDLSDNVEPDHKYIPMGSQFSELHYMVGMNFDMRNR